MTAKKMFAACLMVVVLMPNGYALAKGGDTPRGEAARREFGEYHPEFEMKNRDHVNGQALAAAIILEARRVNSK